MALQMKNISLAVACVITVLAGMTLSSVSLAQSVNPNDAFQQMSAITTEDSIDKTEYVNIGGIKQWVSVRGRHKDNPVLLVLHGGPGFTTSPVAYVYMRQWEEYFTVVQWDQRGAGKTFQANDPAVVAPTMSVDQLVTDADQLVEFLRTTYKKDKIIVLAHSFGTVIGTKLIQRQPERFHAYIGMGQFVDFSRSELLGYEATLADARAEGNAEAVSDLERIFPFPDPLHPERNQINLGTERRWLAHYGGYYWRGNTGHNTMIARMGPEASEADMKARDEGQAFSIKALWDEIGHLNLSNDVQFQVPVFIFQGRHDRGTASSLVAEWFSNVKAPKKTFIWFETSAHMVYEEEPGRVLVNLVNEVLPLTKSDMAK